MAPADTTVTNELEDLSTRPLLVGPYHRGRSPEGEHKRTRNAPRPPFAKPTVMSHQRTEKQPTDLVWTDQTGDPSELTELQRLQIDGNEHVTLNDPESFIHELP